MVWYGGWKNFLIEESGVVDDRGKIEETFYLMMLMIDQKVSESE